MGTPSHRRHSKTEQMVENSLWGLPRLYIILNSPAEKFPSCLLLSDGSRHQGPLWTRIERWKKEGKKEREGGRSKREEKDGPVPILGGWRHCWGKTALRFSARVSHPVLVSPSTPKRAGSASGRSLGFAQRLHVSSHLNFSTAWALCRHCTEMICGRVFLPHWYINYSWQDFDFVDPCIPGTQPSPLAHNSRCSMLVEWK